jgi:uncharacterized membrane protein
LTNQMNFAPISGQPSLRLRLASGYFILSGLMSLAIIAVGLIMAFTGTNEIRAAVFEHPIQTFLNAAIALGFVLAGYYLRKGSRLGGFIAIVVFLPPLAEAILGHDVRLGSLIIGAVGVIVIVSIWEELV